MSDSAPPTITVEKRLSRKGVEFTVGRATDKDAPSTTPTEAETPSNSKEDFGISVIWEPSLEWKKVTTSEEFRKKTGIVYYIFHKDSDKGPNYACTLKIMTEESYDYEFFDETGDSYELDVFVTLWEHYVNFTSTKPTILFITGS